MKKTNFIQKLINIFGINNVIKNLKSLKGKALIQNARDEEDKPIYVKNFV